MTKEKPQKLDHEFSLEELVLLFVCLQGMAHEEYLWEIRGYLGFLGPASRDFDYKVKDVKKLQDIVLDAIGKTEWGKRVEGK